MRNLRLTSTITGVLLLLGCQSSARAQIIYTDPALFASNIQPGFYLETFNALPQGTLLTSPLSFSAGGFSYTASALADFFNVGPVGDTWLSTNQAAELITFNFTSGNVTAVGGYFFETDVLGDPTIGGTITALLNNGATLSVTNPSPNTFIGFTSSSPITSLTLNNFAPGGISEFVTVNDLIAATAVPEPASLSLVGIGLGVLLVRKAARRPQPSPALRLIVGNGATS